MLQKINKNQLSYIKGRNDIVLYEKDFIATGIDPNDKRVQKLGNGYIIKELPSTGRRHRTRSIQLNSINCCYQNNFCNYQK